MRLGILKAGQLPPDLESIAGSNATLFRVGLGPMHQYVDFEVAKGELPDSGQSLDGYLITGSSASAYDAHPWIVRLSDWLKALDPKTPLVGICFGHQIMAQAYGGVVAKADNGLTVGLHEYQVKSCEPWMGVASRFVLPVSHYDQVIELPADARVIARSDFCPYAGLTYTQRRALSFQAHPEFDLDLTAKVIDRWKEKGMLDEEAAARAHSSLRQPDDRITVLGWIRCFFEGTAG